MILHRCHIPKIRMTKLNFLQFTINVQTQSMNGCWLLATLAIFTVNVQNQTTGGASEVRIHQSVIKPKFQPCNMSLHLTLNECL